MLVALSGGPDSTALAAALAVLRDRGALAAVHALHVDHGLRPGGDAEALHAAGVCAALGVPFERARVVVGAGNVQAEARRARYAALRAAATRLGATRIATGHTRTDQAETVLLRLLRGAGARGLAGIPPRRGAVVRPLIDRSRAEGLAWLEARGLPFLEDPTNATDRFARNRLRRHLWPAVLALEPAAERALARAADLLRDDERALARLARAAAGPRARGARAAAGTDLAAFARAPRAVRRRVVRALFADAGGRTAALGAAHVARVLALARRRDGPRARTGLPGGLEARVRGGRLELGPPLPRAAGFPPVEVSGPGAFEAGGVRLALSAARPALVPWPLLVRPRRPGDRFRPDRGRGGKKLKAWLIDRKVPAETRDSLLVVAAPDGSVVAVPQLAAVAEGYGPSGAGLAFRTLVGRADGRTARGGPGCYNRPPAPSSRPDPRPAPRRRASGRRGGGK